MMRLVESRTVNWVAVSMSPVMMRKRFPVSGWSAWPIARDWLKRKLIPVALPAWWKAVR